MILRISCTRTCSLTLTRSQVYANHMKESGCCGADEFLKLWAYTLIEYERVVHLDMDSMITGNMVRASATSIL